MSSAFAQLPAAVLSDIMWLTPFVDTLRCEQVCRSWQQVLKRSAADGKDPHPAWSPGILGEELELRFSTHTEDWERPALKLEQFLLQMKYSNHLACKHRGLHSLP